MNMLFWHFCFHLYTVMHGYLFSQDICNRCWEIYTGCLKQTGITLNTEGPFSTQINPLKQEYCADDI